jgi:hypothetical protein
MTVQTMHCPDCGKYRAHYPLPLQGGVERYQCGCGRVVAVPPPKQQERVKDQQSRLFER